MSDFDSIGTDGLVVSAGAVDVEFLPMLKGVAGRRFFHEMAENSPIAGAILQAFEKTLTGLNWSLQPASDDEAAHDAAEFVESCRIDMSQSWDAIVSEICTQFTYGFTLLEIVYKRRGGDVEDPSQWSRFDDGRIGWRKWSPRAQSTIMRWEWSADGRLVGAWQTDPNSGAEILIPLSKALLFRTTQAGNNPEGRSILRSGVVAYFRQKRIEEIEAIGIERDLAGLPVATVPAAWLQPDASDAERRAADSVREMVTQIKRNEQEGVLLPAAIDASSGTSTPLVSLSLLTSGGQRSFDTDRIVRRYEQRIAMSVLMDFLMLGHEGVGSHSLGISKIDLWKSTIDAVASSICDTINTHAIPKLLSLNGIDVELSPLLTASPAKQADVEAVTGAIQRLASVGVLTPDDGLELAVRQLLELPDAVEERGLL